MIFSSIDFVAINKSLEIFSSVPKNKIIAKLQNISEIHSALGFTEFDILEKYCISVIRDEIAFRLDIDFLQEVLASH